MRETWMGSGIYSTQEDRHLSCDSCDREWEQLVDFDDYGRADVRYTCPSCYEYVYYYEDRNEKDDEPDYDSLEVYING